MKMILKGDVHLNVFTKMIGRRESIQRGRFFHAEGYRLKARFYDYNSKFKTYSYIYNNGKIVEWYFDFKKISKRMSILIAKGWYLDSYVLTPDGKIILLDEDEFDGGI